MHPGEQIPEHNRRTRIADAALTLLGREGSRSLTHRRVDREAGLPESSTSYYCKRRADLLALALERYAEIEHRDLMKYAAVFQGAMEPDVIARTVAAQITRWLKIQNRALLSARFELFLSASRDPELAAIVRKNRKTFRTTIESALKLAGATAPRLTAKALISFMEGLLLDALRADEPVMTRPEIERVVRAILQQDGRG